MTPEQMRIALAKEAGWQWIELNGHHAHNAYWFTSPTEKLKYRPELYRDHLPDSEGFNVMGGYKTLPNYPEDANAALEIVAMMRERGWDFHASNERNVWDASFLHRSLLHNNAACAPTLPLAICEAARKALSL